MAVGDVAFQQEYLTRIEEFRAQGTTIFQVSHSLSTIGEYCDRVAWLEEGRIAGIGTPAAVLPDYAQAVAGG